MEERMEEHFGSLKSEITRLRAEFREDEACIKFTLKEVKKKGLFRLVHKLLTTQITFQTLLETLLTTSQRLQESMPAVFGFPPPLAEIKAKGEEEVIALDKYSRKENL